MNAEASIILPPLAARHWVILMIWGVLMGCTMTPVHRLPSPGTFLGQCHSNTASLRSDSLGQQSERSFQTDVVNPSHRKSALRRLKIRTMSINLIPPGLPAAVERESAGRPPSPMGRTTHSRR